MCQFTSNELIGPFLDTDGGLLLVYPVHDFAQFQDLLYKLRWTFRDQFWVLENRLIHREIWYYIIVIILWCTWINLIWLSFQVCNWCRCHRTFCSYSWFLLKRNKQSCPSHFGHYPAKELIRHQSICKVKYIWFIQLIPCQMFLFMIQM